MKKTTKNLLAVLAIIVIAALLSGAAVFWNLYNSAVEECTQQAYERPVSEIDSNCKPFVKTLEA